MTISSSLNAGIAGLSANATRLASISDNISNASTFGYKRVQTDFQSMVISSSGGSYSAGGTRATSQRLISERGSLVATTNPTDLAVRGRGMLPVAYKSGLANNNGAAEMLLTTTGSFRTDENGYLTTKTGLVLLGWPANPDGTIPVFPRDTAEGLEPVRINVNQLTGEPTTRISLGVNLPATETESTADGDVQELSIEYFDNLGKSESIRVEFTPTVPGSGASNQWTMTLRDTAQSNAVIGEYTLEFESNRAQGGTLASVATVSGGAYDAATGKMIVNVAGGPIEVDLGLIGQPDGITQVSDRFAPMNVARDGSPVGNMTDVEVDDRGYVHAIYDTGVTKKIFKVPLVDLPNPNGMTAMDNQTYKPSLESGKFFMWDAGDGPTGDIVSFAREESATDVAGELTAMIQTQRAYSSNAKVIQTVDEMLQETTNIKR